MSIDHPGFFDRAGPFTVAELAEAVGAALPEAVEVGAAQRLIADIAPLDQARSDALTFLDNPKYRDQLATTEAAACLMSPEMAGRAPDGVIPLLTNQPYHGFARALGLMFPTAIMPATLSGETATAIDPTAVIEDGAIVEPGALIGPEAQIGRGARIAAGAVIGRRCCIGRDSIVGPNAVVACTLVGDRVVLHAGVRIGQDGFGFAMGPSGHLKVPQVGRVIIQDDVEIGAGTTIDRGALKDTVIGEGTKIDNLVQIGHNVVIGRHCVIVAQVGISGSTELGDFVVMGGHAGAVGHIKIGNGAQIAGASHVKNDVPPGSRMGGTPARSLKQWAREIAALRRLASR